MTRQELRAWRLERWQPGTTRPLAQRHGAELVRAPGGYRTWQRWESGTSAVPAYLGAFLRLVDEVNGYKREIQPLTLDIINGTEDEDAYLDEFLHLTDEMEEQKRKIQQDTMDLTKEGLNNG